ncbi:MAG: M15 family metallopeptidase [Cyanobacteriota bacterium]|nr:M15 family metallopeptidase [Cyanobacteriota bacterium]
MTEEIPEAIRDTPTAEFQSSTSQSQRKWLFWKLLALAVAVFGLILILNYRFGILLQPTPAPAVQENSAPSTVVSIQPSVSQPMTESVEEAITKADSSEEEEVSDDLLGHFPYDEASSSELKSVTADGSIQLRVAAAQSYLDMADAARQLGIRLVPLSGFRTVEDQEYLFFEVKAQRGQNASKRAEVSAPPGYSEHHTGYAIDIGDADFPSRHLKVSFEQTKAFQWLEENAAFYSFELSFPKDNPQGVSYEPWHWRYVGDVHSLETFYKAKPKPGTSPQVVQTETEP